MPLVRILEVHASSGVYVLGIRAENIGMAGTQLESQLMNQMACVRTKISRNAKRKRKRKLWGPLVLVYSNKNWEVREQGSFLDFNFKVQIHFLAAQTERGVLYKRGTRLCLFSLLL